MHESRLQTVASPHVPRKELHAARRGAGEATHGTEARGHHETTHTRYGASIRLAPSLASSRAAPAKAIHEHQDSSAIKTPDRGVQRGNGQDRQWGSAPRHVGLVRPSELQQNHQSPPDIALSPGLSSRANSNDELEDDDGDADQSSSISSSTSASVHDRPMARGNNGITESVNSNKSNSRTSSISKESRYLREMDRRDILQRIRQGEKQSALAKEYNISRSAVCNLNKKRDTVLARKCDNPLAKHPKLNRRAASKATTTTSAPPAANTDTHVHSQDASPVVSVAGGGMVGRFDAHSVTQQLPHGGLRQLKLTHRAVALLLSRVQDRATSERDFRRCADRLMRLVLEEAMALVQLRVVGISNSKDTNATNSGVVTSHSTCALSLEQDNCPMLDLLNLLEPDLSTGYVRISGTTQSRSPPATTPLIVANLSESNGAHSQSRRLLATILQAHLPRDLNQYNVLLLDTVVNSGEAVCCAIERVLTQLGGVEKRISVVTLFIAIEAVKEVGYRYPDVCIVTADAVLSRSQDVEHVARSNAFRQRLTSLM